MTAAWAHSRNRPDELSLRASRSGAESKAGFTLIEVLIAMTIVTIILCASIPIYMSFVEDTRVKRTVQDLRVISSAIEIYYLINGEWPISLADVEFDLKKDSWGRPYEYLDLATARRGQMRKDRFLVPINTHYDLYSVGPDGKSRASLTARDSRDDIIRADDGAFFGVASSY